MKDHGIVESRIKPESITLDEFAVWEAENIEEFEVQNEEGETEVHYRYRLIQHSKDDYIISKFEANQMASDLAIAELVEIMIGGM